jgi:DNA-binding NtrC family response regulator
MKPRARARRAPLLLVVDGGRQEYLGALAGAGYRVGRAATLKQALAARPRPDGLIVELIVPDADLRDLSAALQTRRRTRALTLIALGTEDRQDAMVRAGASFCKTPCPPEELVEIVKRALPLAA